MAFDELICGELVDTMALVRYLAICGQQKGRGVMVGTNAPKCALQIYVNVITSSSRGSAEDFHP